MSMEEYLGMGAYFTRTPGIGGKIKAAPEDFVVEEEPLLPPEEPGGPLVAALVRSRNWETNRLVRVLARALRISRRRIHFAGTKDKRAVTTQLMQFEAPLAEVQRLRLRDVEVLKAYTTARRIDLGDLVGNRFRLVIRGVEVQREETAARLQAVLAELGALGGFPNFFGVQRFGVVRPITHLVGKAIARGDFEGAVRTYVGNPLPGESEEAIAARAHMEVMWDPSWGVAHYPRELTFEKAMLNHLVAHQGDCVGALKVLPRNLQLMFIHAYQSYLFNRILTARAVAGLPLGDPLEGDLLFPLDRHGIPDRDRPMPVEASNRDHLGGLCRQGRAFVTALVVGADPLFASGPMGEIERKVLAEEGVEPREFIIPRLPHLSTKGTRRELLIPLGDMRTEVGEGTVTLEFRLPRGAYATSLLREVMKAGPMSY